MKVAVIFNKQETLPSDVINIFGPKTKERYNPKTVQKVASALEKGGHNVKVIEGNINVADELRDFMPRVIAGEHPGMVFNMAYGIQGHSRYTHIPAMLEMLGVPYVGSGPQAHAISLDKVMSKILFQQQNLPTPEFWVFSSPEESFEDVRYPVIVKPKMEAVSMGLRVVDNEQDLREAVGHVVELFQQQALVERFISGREFAVGLLGNSLHQEVLPIVELDLEGDPDAIQTQSDKIRKPLEKICPAKIDDELAEQMRSLSQRAFRALELNDFARLDYRMDKDGNLFILEINSMASLGLTGSYVHAAKVQGYTYEALVNRILDVAAVRYFGEGYPKVPGADQERKEKAQPLRVRVRSYIRGHLPTMEDHLRRMVEINTYVHNSEGVNDLGEYISGFLSSLKFRRQVYPQEEVGNILYFTNHEGEQNDILLLGHLDTPYSFEDYVPFREERGRCFGSGVAESKGGLTIMLWALKALQFTRRLGKVKCGLLLISDNSLGGRISKRLIGEKGGMSKCAVGLSFGNVDGGIVTTCMGRLNYRVKLTYSKTDGQKDRPNVIATLSNKVRALRKLSSEEGGILVSPTSLEARTVPDPAPDRAVLSFAVELRQKIDEEALDKEIRTTVKKNLKPSLHVRIKREVSQLPVVDRELNSQLYERVEQIARRLEIKVKPAHSRSPSYICYLPEDVPALDGLGPIGGGAASHNEYVLRDSLIDRASLLALMVFNASKDTNP